MKPFFSKKLFPFSPGIPWTIKNNKYVVPEINGIIWNRVLKDKDFIVTCYGGFMESFFSLCYCEALSALFPEKKIQWMGYHDFNSLVKLQGIAKITSFDLGYEVISKYPVPIFMDAENNAYFNVLNNYIYTSSYRLKNAVINKDLWANQIYKNCMIPWDKYNPIIRLDNTKYKKWSKDNSFHNNSKFIVIFHKSWKTMHTENCLGWNEKQIRELAALVRHKGISIVACGFDNFGDYYNSGNVFFAPQEPEIMIGLMQNAWGVLSKDIDNLMISMVLSKSSIIMSREVNKIFELYENAEFFDAQNIIFTDKDLYPKNVYQIIEGMHE